MAKVSNELSHALNTGEKVLTMAIQNLATVKENYQDDRLLFVSAQLVEMAHIYVHMTRAVKGLWAYVREDNPESAKTEVYEAFQAIDHVHAKTPNKRSLFSREYLYEAMNAIKEKDHSQAKELLGSIAMIADTTRISIIEHFDFIEKRMAA